MTRTRAGTLILTLAMAASCEVRRVSDAPPRNAPAVAMQGEERPMAVRREAQVMLDSARTLLEHGQQQASVRLLRRAAGFFTVQANAPPSAGTEDLLDVAHALESFADAVHLGRKVEPTRLDHLSAHANLAEAERHAALATVAWSTRSRESVCDELTMVADHVERAALDGGLLVSPPMRDLLEEIRGLARTLASPGVDLHTLDEPLASLHIEIRAMHRRLEQGEAIMSRTYPVSR